MGGWKRQGLFVAPTGDLVDDGAEHTDDACDGMPDEDSNARTEEEHLAIESQGNGAEVCCEQTCCEYYV